MSDEIKSFIKLIVLMIFVVVIILSIDFPSPKEITLEDVKNRIKETKRIDVFLDKERLRTIDDEEIVQKVIDITSSLNEEGPNISINQIKDGHILYFRDKNNKILARARFYNHYVFIAGNKEYMLEHSAMKELRELLGFKSLD